jgi:4-amino-4-deoxy-L-arabinose transferase-like glycosyltransferase
MLIKENLKSDYIIYILLSVCFIILHFATITTLLPWVDEVMFADTPVNYVCHHSWSTTAWYGSGDTSPFCSYPPFFQWMETIWLRIWGFSIYSYRSLNFVIVFFIGLTILSFVKNELLRSDKLNGLSVVLFTLLLWGMEELAWMTRNGRPDLMIALFAILAFRQIWLFIRKPEDKLSKYWIAFWSVLTVMTGIQGAAFLVMSMLFCLIFYKEQRLLLYKAFKMVVLGLTVGFIILCIFFFYNGYLKAFITNIVVMSSSARKLLVIVRPYIADFLHLKPVSTETANTSNENGGLFYFILDSFKYLGFPAMLILSVVLAFFHRKQIKVAKMFNPGWAFVIFSAYTLLAMNLAGRLAIYYRWMIIYPLLISMLIFLNQAKEKRKIQYGICMVATIVLSFIGVHSTFYRNSNIDSDESYQVNLNDLHTFLTSADIPKNAYVAAPFMAFYEVKNLYENVYFPQIYPHQLIKKLDYLIVYGETQYPDGYSLYGQASMIAYLQELQERDDVTLRLVKEDVNNDLRIYQVTIR